jgi:Family of unknown function (DUF5996)
VPATVAQSVWPELPYAAWKDTYATLHLWTQVIGKIRLGLTPWLNHSWHVTLYVTPRGLTTGPMPFAGGDVAIDFDFIDHVLWLSTSAGHVRQVMLRPVAVAEFYGEVMAALAGLGVEVHINETPSEIENATPFSKDHAHASYDPEFATRHFRVLAATQKVFAHFRTGFLGKASPVHFFWGSFDLVVTRFSGRRAPLPTSSGAPGLSLAVARDAYSHEVSSAGFWPGDDTINYPAYYCYAYPEPEGFAAATARPAAAFYLKDYGEFILPYDAVRKAANPDATLMEFLQSTYEAAADLSKWERAALEGPLGEIGKPRPT